MAEFERAIHAIRTTAILAIRIRQSLVARFLPLWGAEERALVRLLVRVINDSLSPDRIEKLLLTNSAMELCKENSIELWHFVRVVERRRQTHEAIDRGLLAYPAEAYRYFEVVGSIRADSIGLDSDSEKFIIYISDAAAKKLQVCFPASPDSIMAASCCFVPRRSVWLYSLAGTCEDRMLMTLISIALGVAPDDGAGSYPVPPRGAIESREALIELLRMRTARILEMDAKE